MKLVVVLMALSLTGMATMIFQAVRQEITLRNLKNHMKEASMDVKRKEQSIVDVKKKVFDLKTKLSNLDGEVEQLKLKKTNSEKAALDLEKSLETCNAQKAEEEKKKTDVAEASNQLKAAHQEAKTKAEEEIKTLKQHILDRDTAICVFADTTKEEARKLCGISEAPK